MLGDAKKKKKMGMSYKFLERYKHKSNVSND